MSITITGIVTILITQFLGDVIAEGEVESFVNVTGLIIGAAVAWYGRFRHGDIDVFGRKI